MRSVIICLFPDQRGVHFRVEPVQPFEFKCVFDVETSTHVSDPNVPAIQSECNKALQGWNTRQTDGEKQTDISLPLYNARPGNAKRQNRNLNPAFAGLIK